MKQILIAFALTAFSDPAWADEKEDLVGAAAKTAEAKNYSFKGQVQLDLPALGGGAGGPQVSKFEGKVDAAEGTYILTEAQEIVRIDGKTAVRPRGDWRVLDENARGAAGGRNLGRMAGMMGGLRPPRAPHEEFKDFGATIEKVSRTGTKETVGEAECNVYAFDLTEEGAKASFPMGGMLGRLGGGNVDAKFKGKGKAWAADGGLVKIETTATLSGSFNNNDFEVTSTRATSIFDVGKTKVQIPEDAKKAIKAKTD
jgi:hypothetical protein